MSFYGFNITVNQQVYDEGTLKNYKDDLKFISKTFYYELIYNPLNGGARSLELMIEDVTKHTEEKLYFFDEVLCLSTTRNCLIKYFEMLKRFCVTPLSDNNKILLKEAGVLEEVLRRKEAFREIFLSEPSLEVLHQAHKRNHLKTLYHLNGTWRIVERTEKKLKKYAWIEFVIEYSKKTSTFIKKKTISIKNFFTKIKLKKFGLFGAIMVAIIFLIGLLADLDGAWSLIKKIIN